jgi:hypothetical protein
MVATPFGVDLINRVPRVAAKRGNPGLKAEAPLGLKIQSIGCYLCEEYGLAIGRSRIYARTLSSQIDNRLSSSFRFHQHMTNNCDNYYSAAN